MLRRRRHYAFRRCVPPLLIMRYALMILRLIFYDITPLRHADMLLTVALRYMATFSLRAQRYV